MILALNALKTDKTFEEIAAINDASFSPLERAPHGTLRDVFDRATVFVRVSTVGSIMAYAFLTIKYDEPYVWVIATAEKYRGRGYAGSLLDEMNEYAKTTGAAGIWLSCHINNATAQKLYLDKGYRVVKVLQNYYGHDEHGLSMRRIL